MLNAADVAAGVAAGIAAEQSNKFIAGVQGEEAAHNEHIKALLRESRDFLRIIAESLDPRLTPTENDNVVLRPYGQSWPVPSYARAHFCLFLASGVTGTPGAYAPSVTTAKLYLEIPGIGTHIKSINPGWNQLDLPPQTLISTADGNTYNAIYSFRDDAIGVAL